jgi:thiol-disulfide isomerase/thioredoxin
MKKIFIVLLAIIIPMYTYYILSRDTVSSDVLLDKIQGAKLIKFSSDMCIDCRELDEIINEVYPEFKDKIVIHRYNINNKSKIKEYNIQVVPTMIFIDKNGVEIRRIEGKISKSDLKKYLKEIAND